MTVKKKRNTKEEKRTRQRCVYVCALGRRKGLKREVEGRVARKTRVQKRVDGERSAVVKE